MSCNCRVLQYQLIRVLVFQQTITTIWVTLWCYWLLNIEQCSYGHEVKLLLNEHLSHIFGRSHCWGFYDLWFYRSESLINIQKIVRMENMTTKIVPSYTYIIILFARLQLCIIFGRGEGNCLGQRIYILQSVRNVKIIS